MLIAIVVAMGVFVLGINIKYGNELYETFESRLYDWDDIAFFTCCTGIILFADVGYAWLSYFMLGTK